MIMIAANMDGLDPGGEGHTPQGLLQLRWKAQLLMPQYRSWLNHDTTSLWCDVYTISPPLKLPWCSDEAQQNVLRTWDCSEVWLHSRSLPNAERPTGTGSGTSKGPCDPRCLREALNVIAQDKARAQYTLLTAPEGLFFGKDRLGLDHIVQVHSSGALLDDSRRFTFSVRRKKGDTGKVLVAIAAK